MSQLPNYFTDSGMDRSDICCWKWISHEKCWCSRGRIIGKVNARWLMVLTDLLALTIHCSSRFESISSSLLWIYIYPSPCVFTAVPCYHPSNAYPQWFMHMPIIFQRHNIDRYMHPLHISQFSEFEFIWGIWSEYMMEYIHTNQEGSKCLLTRLTYNCAHLRWTIESLTVEFRKK